MWERYFFSSISVIMFFNITRGAWVAVALALFPLVADAVVVQGRGSG